MISLAIPFLNKRHDLISLPPSLSLRQRLSLCYYCCNYYYYYGYSTIAIATLVGHPFSEEMRNPPFLVSVRGGGVGEWGVLIMSH